MKMTNRDQIVSGYRSYLVENAPAIINKISAICDYFYSYLEVLYDTGSITAKQLRHTPGLTAYEAEILWSMYQ